MAKTKALWTWRFWRWVGLALSVVSSLYVLWYYTVRKP
jgi:hypothetical protein